MRHTVALNVHPSHRGSIKQDVDHMVVQEIDLVDVQHPTVSPRQQPWGERVLAVSQHFLQIERPHHPVLGGTDG